MKSISKIIFSVAIALLSVATIFASPNLPKVTIMGKTFYQYISEKGESLAGIAKKFGWNLYELTRLNKEVSTPLDKGTLLHYPAPSGSESSNSAESVKTYGQYPLEHVVKHGETVYGISRQYNVSLDAIYAANPGAKMGIKAGQTLLINPESTEDMGMTEQDNSTEKVSADHAEEESPSAGLIYYKVEDGDSLYGISRKFNTSIEELFVQNPGLNNSDLKAGETIKVMTDSKAEDVHVEKVVEKHIDGIASYKVKRGDTWESIAQRKGISIDVLKEANPTVNKLNRGDIIAVPEVESREVEKVYVVEDPRESTPEGRQELYNEVHSIIEDNSAGEDNTTEVNIAIVLDNVDSNKDLEFSRGALLAVERMKTRPFRTRLTILDGAQGMSEVVSSLDNFQPSLIIATADKQMPKYLAEYARQNGVALINAFDVKDESYIDNPNVVQYLAPTSYFNDEVALYAKNRFEGVNVILVGSMDSSDTMGQAIVAALTTAEGTNVVEVPVDELAQYELEPDMKYLVYSSASKNNDVKNLLEKVKVLRERNMLTDINVMGRPNWITFADSQKDLFGDNYVVMPTRFYFDANSLNSKSFIDDYKELFGHTPIKSYPVYSATAYDILTYFTPNMAETSGDFNAPFRREITLQSNIDLKRVSNWGGLVNPDVYVIEFLPAGMYNKEVLGGGVKP